jgi:glucose-1-phosphate adenylyltransferase
VASFEFDGYWTDIGNISSFFEANIELTDPVPEFNLFDNEKAVYTRPRLLAPSKVFGTKFNYSVVAEGSIIHADKVERSIIGIRSRIGEKTMITHAIVMGNDYFQTLEQIMALETAPSKGLLLTRTCA